MRDGALTAIAVVRAAGVRSLEYALVRADRRTGQRVAAIAWRAAGQLLSHHKRDLLIRRCVDVIAAAGAVALFDGYTTALAHHPDDDAKALAHELLLRVDRVAAAETVRDTISGDRQRAHLRQAACLAAGDAAAAWQIAATAAAPDPSMRDLGVRALQRLGRPSSVLDQLGRSDVAAVPRAEEYEFDASWDLGDGAAVRAVAGRWTGQAARDVGRVDRLIRRYELDGWSSHDVGRLLLAEHVAPADDGWRIQLLVHFGWLDDALDLADRRELRTRGSPATRLALAAAAYVERDFRASRRLTRSLIGTSQHWAAEKLEARMLVEEGAALDATLHRDGRARLRPAFDDVYYLARLQLGERRTALADYLHVADRRRLVATFGPRARADLVRSPIDRSGLFVVPQDGPADEVAMAATYPLLADRSGGLTAACDPRLHTLLSRSFPAVDFVPTERRASRPQFGFLGPGRAPRDGPLFDLLDHRAVAVAERASQVVLGRSLIQLTESADPFEPYIVPEPSAIVAHQQDLGSPTIGLVWRSEFVTNSRSVHFLGVPELRPLTRLAATFVCLQHDVTSAERTELKATFGDRVRFVTGVDLRNDLDAAAALVAACDAVVGVGTTLVELAAATGTTTICLHPTLLSSWRVQRDGGDYWHATMFGAAVEGPNDRARCVDVAVRRLERAGFQRWI